MARPAMVDPVKLCVAVLWSDSAALNSAMDELVERWGEVDFTGPDHPFDATDYYEAEMGRGLKRRLVTFRRLVPPDVIVQGKHICNGIEDRLAAGKGRRINLDVGYLDHNKIVLASFKAAGQKIYLGDSVWADLVARYREGCYCPFEWTFPDFRDGRYDLELSEIRRAYMDQLRKARNTRHWPTW